MLTAQWNLLVWLWTGDGKLRLFFYPAMTRLRKPPSSWRGMVVVPYFWSARDVLPAI